MMEIEICEEFLTNIRLSERHWCFSLFLFPFCLLHDWQLQERSSGKIERGLMGSIPVLLSATSLKKAFGPPATGDPLPCARSGRAPCLVHLTPAGECGCMGSS